jgi:NTE family protein
MAQLLLNPFNWLRVSSPFFDRSDLASEYYDKNIFDGKTYGDMLDRKGPIILVNATDMSQGFRFTFHQKTFDAMCSDLSKFSVARACAASSAVPGLLSPLVLKNHAGSCGYVIPPELEAESRTYRQRDARQDLLFITDPEKKSYFQLIDGGVADNLGLRAIEESIDSVGNFWTVMKGTKREKVRKIVFIVVNAESKLDSMWNKLGEIPPMPTIVSNYSTIAISRYNRETMAILQESFSRWAHQVQMGRCPEGKISKEPGSCGDIKFYLVDIRFENLKDQSEADYLARLATSFRLPPEDVDRLRAAAQRLTKDSVEFQKFLKDLNSMPPAKYRSR